MIGHNLSNCIHLQQDTNVIFGGEKRVKNTQLYHHKVVCTQNGNNGSLDLVLKPMEVVVQPIL